MTARETLLRDIEAFLRDRRMTETRFGLAAVNDGHLVRRLRGGGNITLRTMERLRAFMAPANSAEPQQVAA